MRVIALALFLLAFAAGHASAQVCAFIPNYPTGPSSGDGIVSIIPTDINKVVRNVPVELIPGGTVFTPDGSILYVANSSSNTVSVLRTSDGLVIATIPVGNSPDGMVVTPDGQFLYVANFNGGTISVIRTSDNAVTDTIDLSPEQVRSLSVSPDGSFMYVTQANSGKVAVIRTSDNMVVDSIDGLPDSNQGNLDVTADGRFLYVVFGNPAGVSVVDLPAGTVISDIGIEEDFTSSIGRFIGPCSVDLGRSIPALSEWGMIAAAAGLGMVGVFFSIRRKRASFNS